MLGQPRVVGGRVERDVERDVHPVLVRGRAQVAHVLLGAELRVHGEVAALGGADRVRRAGVVRAGDERVVAALAVLAADRVERQQVEHVEAEVGDLRARAPRRPSGRPRSAGTARTRRRSGPSRGRPRAASGLSSVVAPSRSWTRLHRLEQLRAERDVELRADRRVGVGQHVVRLLDRVVARRPWRAASARSSSTTPSDSSPERSSSRSASTLRRSSSCQVRPAVGPGLDRELPAPGRLDRELAAPAHAVEVRRRGRASASRASVARRAPCTSRRRELLVAVAEDVGGDGDGVADGALGGVPAAVEDGRRMCDPDPARRFAALRWRASRRGVSDNSTQ